MTTDPINHPPHYTAHPSGVECIQITEGFSFNIGNIIKYLWRADEKGAPIDDLRKAEWYLQREITRRIDEANTSPLVTKSVSLPDLTLQTDTIHTTPVEAPRFLDYADAKEQVEIGKDYYHGTNNRKQDFEVAVEWWTLAAAQGNAEAQWLLGNAYLFGRGVEKNKKEAHRLWKLSQQNRFGGKDAQNPIPQTYTAPLVAKSDSSPNLTGNTLAYAQAGDARRQYEMGKMCYYGDGMPQDSEQAVEWWKLAAAQGNADAQLSLASAYRTGTGVDQNQRTANYWLEQAGLQRTEEQPQ